jgi:hypothetical protein
MDQRALFQFELKHEVAHARLAVAEEFTWGLASAFAALAYLTGLTIVGAVVVFGLALWLLPRHYRREERRAEEAYHRAAGLGRFVRAAND